MIINTAHIIVTEKCGNACPMCCNNNYKLADVPYITKEELDNTKTICLTGGEPFLSKDIEKYVRTLKKYVDRIYVYASGYELLRYIERNEGPELEEFFKLISGFSISPKTLRDWQALYDLLDNYDTYPAFKENRLYVFIEDPGNKNYALQVDVHKPFENVNPFIYETIAKCAYSNFKIFFRTWQDEIVSPDNEIFRNINIEDF